MYAAQDGVGHEGAAGAADPRAAVGARAIRPVLRYIILHYITLYYIISYHIKSYYVMSYHTHTQRRVRAIRPVPTLLHCVIL